MRSARDCYERAGYQVIPDPTAAPNDNWTCVIAAKTGERLSLCEHTYTDSGRKWASVEVWLEQSINDRLPGPFWNVIVSQPAH